MDVHVLIVVNHADELAELVFVLCRKDFLDLFYFLRLWFNSIGRQDKSKMLYLVFSPDIICRVDLNTQVTKDEKDFLDVKKVFFEYAVDIYGEVFYIY